MYLTDIYQPTTPEIIDWPEQEFDESIKVDYRDDRGNEIEAEARFYCLARLVKNELEIDSLRVWIDGEVVTDSEVTSQVEEWVENNHELEHFE